MPAINSATLTFPYNEMIPTLARLSQYSKMSYPISSIEDSHLLFLCPLRSRMLLLADEPSSETTPALKIELSRVFVTGTDIHKATPRSRRDAGGLIMYGNAARTCGSAPATCNISLLSNRN